MKGNLENIQRLVNNGKKLWAAVANKTRRAESLKKEGLHIYIYMPQEEGWTYVSTKMHSYLKTCAAYKLINSVWNKKEFPQQQK
jgi:hypothetical protein